MNGLTDRQQSVITLLRLGLTNRQLAIQLNLSENTIKDHLKALFAKYNAHSRLELVLAVERTTRSGGSKGRRRRGSVAA